MGLLTSLGSLFLRRRQAWLFVALGIVLYCVFAVPPRPGGVGGSGGYLLSGGLNGGSTTQVLSISQEVESFALGQMLTRAPLCSTAPVLGKASGCLCCLA